MKLSRRAVLLAMVIAVLLAACSAAPTATPIGGRGYINQQVSSDEQTPMPGKRELVQRWHDDELLVTCWIFAEYYSKGISCLPDGELAVPDWWR